MDLHLSHAMLAGVLFVFGAMIGSFLNVVIHRLPRVMAGTTDRGYGLAKPSSHCPHCGAMIRAYHNVPILGYMWLRGRCADCDGRISPRYPVIEFLAGAIPVVALWTHGTVPEVGLIWVYVAALLALAAIDLDTFLLPDAIVLPLGIVGIAANAFGVFVPLSESLLGAALGFGGLYLLRLVASAVAKREAMGLGDVKLFAVVGAWNGWVALFPVLFLACLIGATAALTARTLRLGFAAKEVPFGPWLAVGAVLWVFLDDGLITLWWVWLDLIGP